MKTKKQTDDGTEFNEEPEDFHPSNHSQGYKFMPSKQWLSRLPEDF
jgi:hypothetical protein